MAFQVALIRSQHPRGRIADLFVSRERRTLEIVGETVRCSVLDMSEKISCHVVRSVLQQARWRRVSFCLPQALQRLLVYLAGKYLWKWLCSLSPWWEILNAVNLFFGDRIDAFLW